MSRKRAAGIKISVLLIGAALLIAGVVVYSLKSGPKDDRVELVFWGHPSLGDDVYTLIHEFEAQNPKYHVIMGSAVAADVTGDSQRLLCAIAGQVPPDVVYFDRFAIGEWAGRAALTDLTPYLEKQDPKDPYRINTEEYYPWAMEEASYRPPGSTEKPRVFGIPTEADVRIFYANGDVLKQAGYVDGKGEPVLPKNWDELRAYGNKLTRFRTPGDPKSGITRLGFAPRTGNSWLYLYAWQAGGEFLNANRTVCTMDSPPVVRALRWMTDVYDDLGGYGQVNALEQQFQGGAMDPFVKDMVVMKTDGNTYLERIAWWRPDMNFVCGAPPMPADRVDKGPVSWSGGFSFVIPTTARNKEGAWKFIQYMYSWPAIQLMEQGKREQLQSEGKIYMPHGLANRVHFERLVKQYVTDNLAMPARFRQAYQVVTDLMPKTRIRPVSPVGQLLWNQHVRATDLATNHALAQKAKETGGDEIQMALASAAPEVQRQLNEIMAPPPPTKVDWRGYFVLYGFVILLPFVLMYFVYQKRKKEYSYKPGEIGAAMLFATPWFIGMVVFVAGPILFTIIFSFTRYDVLSPARYVGLENFRQIFKDESFYKGVWNTVYMLLRVPLGMAVSLIIALMLNKAVRGIGVYRTLFYLPAIMPMIAVCYLWLWVLNGNNGVLNDLLNWCFGTAPMQWLAHLCSTFAGHPVHFVAPLWMADANWSKPALILMSVWSAGGGMIIWLAGLQSIPPQLYEAASIDGAGPWKQFWNVTFPMLSPYILFNTIIGVIGTMQVFQEAFITTQGGPVDSTLFYSYNLFKQAFQFFRMGYASAMAWILFVLVLALTLLQLWLSKRWVHYDRS